MTSETPSPAFDAFVSAARALPPAAAIVLGSGLASVAKRLTSTCTIPFIEVPGLPAASACGHQGQLTLGDWAGRRVLVFEGRVHQYEGHAWRSVTLPVTTAARLQARCLILTNAAGGIRDDLQPGCLMAVRAQGDWTRPLGSTRTELSSPYGPRLLRLLHQAAADGGIALHEGVYAATTGPSYETPAEIRALRECGVDAVGMSTVREAEAAREHGLECAAISCITNRAAGLCDGMIQHGDVLATAASASDRLGRLLEGLLGRLE